jgi:hypothetical protein
MVGGHATALEYDVNSPCSVLYTPPDLTHLVERDSRHWEEEAAAAACLPTHHQKAEPFWRRRRSPAVPSWLLPGSKDPTIAATFEALKRSCWRRRAYRRDFRVRHVPNGGLAFETCRPSTDEVTNVWSLADVLDVRTDGAVLELECALTPTGTAHAILSCPAVHTAAVPHARFAGWPAGSSARARSSTSACPARPPRPRSPPRGAARLRTSG